jgi:membrane protein YdbS with pleckstrin-like domain
MDLEFQPNRALVKIWWIEWCIALVLFYVLPILPVFYFREILAALITSVVMLPFFIVIALWMPYYYRTLNYFIKSDHIRIESGVWWKRIKTIPFRMITDIKAIQGPLARVFDLGGLHVQTAGMGAQNIAEGILRGVSDYKEKQAEILKRIREYSPRGEIKTTLEEPIESEEKLLKEMLTELREIRKKIQ